MTIIINSKFRVYKWSFIVPQLNAFIYILSIAAFVLHWQELCTKIVQLAKLKMFMIRLFSEQVCQPPV